MENEPSAKRKVQRPSRTLRQLDLVCELQRQGYHVPYRYMETDRQTILKNIDHCAAMAEQYRQQRGDDDRFSRGFNMGFETAWGLAAAGLAQDIGIACDALHHNEERLNRFREAQAKLQQKEAA